MKIFYFKRNMTVDKAKIRIWLVFASLFSWPLNSFCADGSLVTEYSIDADFRNISSRTFSVTMDAKVTNQSKTEIKELLWMLYPNRFLQSLPNLNDLNFRRIYPDDVSTGFLKIISLEQNEVDVSDQLQALKFTKIPENTLFSLRLAKPLQPGDTTRFHFVMTLRVPEKFGSFGYYRKRLTLSGGWTPYVVSYRDGMFFPSDQAPRSTWKIHVKANDSYILGSDLTETPHAVVSENTFEKKNLGQIPIQIERNLRKSEFQKNDFQLKIIMNENHPENITDPFQKIFEPWVDYLDEQKLNKVASKKNLSFVQAPLREMLALDSGEISFFSDRTFKIMNALKTFHNVPLIRTMFAQTFFEQIVKKENDRDYYWVNEVVSSQLTEDFLKTQAYKHRDARDIGAIRVLSILPSIDQIIHTPQFAFFDVFYNFAYPYDPVRDDFVKFQHRRQFGISILAHMHDELGDEAVENIVRTYLESPDKSFMQVAQDYTGKKLDQRFEHWLTERPVVNYKIKKIASEKTEGGYQSLVTISKESSKTFEEPVTVRVVDQKGEGQNMVWDSTDESHTFDVQTKHKLKSVEIDPNSRLLETKLSDNRDPPYLKFVLTESYFSYDFNAKQPIILVESVIRQKYGGKNLFNFGGFYQSDSYGGNIGYVRLFGHALDSLRLSDGVGLSFSYTHLDRDYVFVDSTPPQNIIVTNAGQVTSVTGSYFFGNQISYTNPLQGGLGGVAVTYGTKALGGDFNYYQVAANAGWVFKLHPSHLFAIRGIFGTSGPDSIPSQVQFRLGGIDAIRGLSVDSEKYIGRNMFLGNAEYRHFLIQDVDWNLGLFRVRDVQGALFTDAGHVTDTVQEKADQAIFTATVPSTSFSDLFKIQDFEADVGYSVHFFVDYLGVTPGLLRFDIARSVTDQTQGYRFYFGVTQSF